MPVRRDPDGKWRYRKIVKTPSGKKVRISGTPAVNTKVAAEEAERQAIARALSDVPPGKEVPRFDEFAETFMRTYARRNKPSEQASKRWILDKRLLPQFGDVPLDEIGRLEVDRFKADLQDEELSPKSINNILGVLSRILRYAVDAEILVKKPKMELFKVADADVDFLDFDEYQRLFEANREEPELYAAILLGGDAGLRRGEILGLDQADVDQRTRRISIKRAVWNGIATLPKSGRGRALPMTERLASALSSVRHLRAPRVFCREDGSGWTWEVVRAAVRRATKRAGLREISWHTLRHTFCSHLAMRGVSAKAIQELAGHTDLKTTQRYMHLAPRVLEDAIHALEQPAPWQNRGKDPNGGNVVHVEKPGTVSDSGLSESDPIGT